MIPIKNLFFILCFFLFFSPGCQGKYYPNDRIRVWETIPKFKVFEFVRGFLQTHGIHNCYYFLESADELRFKCFRNGKVVEMVTHIMDDPTKYVPTVTTVTWI